MNIFQALLMGILQGFTEFLPISSSGHLVLFSQITGLTSSVQFDLVLHLGSLFAVLVFERKEVLNLIKHPLSKTAKTLVLSTLITTIVALCFSSVISSSFEGEFLPFCFLISAIILFLSDKFSPRQSKNIGYSQAVILGLAQGLAVFPGISRSGTTYSVGNTLGVKKEENLNFCFLLSIPVIVGGVILSFFSSKIQRISFSLLLVGFIASFVCALASLKVIKKVFLGRGFTPFIYYLTCLSVFLTLNDLLFHIF